VKQTEENLSNRLKWLLVRLVRSRMAGKIAWRLSKLFLFEVSPSPATIIC
jgi:hypothetical protein